MLTGTHTPYQIFSTAINEWGLRTRTGKIPSKSTIYKIFNNPFYYGEFEFPKKSGAWYKSNHKPMITKQEFDRVQRMMRKPDNPRPINNYFAYGGCTLHCSECGCAITGMAKTKKQRNGNVHHYVYYGCTKRRGVCRQMPVTEAQLTAHIEKILSEIQMPQAVHDFMMDWVQQEHDKQYADSYALNGANKKALELVQNKISGLIDMCAKGLITDDEFQDRRSQMNKEKDRLQQLIDNTDQSVETWLYTADSLLTFAEKAAIRFKNGSPELQRGILVSLGWNLCIKDKELDLSKEKWIEPVKRIAKRLQEELPPSEPVLPLEYKGKIENLLKSPFLCSLLQDVRNAFIETPNRTWFPIVDQWRQNGTIFDL